jgi:hypothetical protein
MISCASLLQRHAITAIHLTFVMPWRAALWHRFVKAEIAWRH